MEFFAGLNTECGYIPLLRELTDDCTTLYILKGTPGCGKSTFLRRLARQAEARGEPYHIVRCSSDLSSLDAVIFPERGVAYADGTAPHTLEPVFPIVRERLIDLGQFLDRSVLLGRRKELEEILAVKQDAFSEAYALIAAAGKVRRSRNALDANTRNPIACAAYAEKLFHRHAAGEETDSLFLCPLVGFTRTGITVLPAGKKTIVLPWRAGEADAILNALQKLLDAASLRYGKIPSPLWKNLLAGILLPESDVLILSGEYIRQPPRRIPGLSARNGNNTSRSAFLGKLCTSLLSGAQEAFARAGIAHSKLEEIYTSAADFPALDAALSGLT